MDAMARGQIGRLPVIDDDNGLAGIVTLGSLALRSRKDKETLAAAKEVSRRSVKGGAASESRRDTGRAKKRAS
jgi:CBS-domain-containing membrane protein